MTERPILFSGPMIRRILAGQKTQTRRPVRIDDTPISEADYKAMKNQRGIPSNAQNVRMLGYLKCDSPAGSATVSSRVHCPYGSFPGDRLWVRETWCLANMESFSLGTPAELADGRPRGPAYGEDPDLQSFAFYAATDHDVTFDSDHETTRWKPSIHMPRWASRITLEVTGIHAERLQAITNDGAIAEGAQRFDDIPDPHPYNKGPRWSMESPRSTEECLGSPRFAFANLWNKLHDKIEVKLDEAGEPVLIAPRSWDANPWVWVVSFRPLSAAEAARKQVA